MSILQKRRSDLANSFIFSLGFSCIFIASAEAGPKYGAHALPLSQKTNIEYFQKNAAPDFWALIPFYLPQPTVRACSATNLALVINAARASVRQNSEDKLLTVDSFANQYTEADYKTAVLTEKLLDRKHVTIKNISRIFRLSLEKMKFSNPKTEVRLFEVDLKNLEKSKQEFMRALKENEKSSDDFIIINFMQGGLTGDSAGGAHVATIGAYDEKKGLVLILDPDREWYEPYWSPAEKVWDSIRDPKSDGNNPGWIYFRAR